MSTESYTLRVNQFTDGPTGHVNITFIGPGINETYGNNFTPEIGVQKESSFTALRIAEHGPTTYFSYISVSKDQFNAALNFTMAADARHGNYQLVCDNCVDFTNEVLRRGGQGDWSIANHLRDGTLTDRYAQIAREICTNPFVNIPSSGLSNFMSAEGLALAQEFLDTLEPFNHPEWFQGLDDPDDWADELFAKAYRIGKRLGLEDGDFTALADMVNSGMGSPIVIDMNGDGISTSHMLTSEVLFDIDGDGDQDKTGWITGEDAFVAWDRNKDGLINDVSELFGGLQRGQGYAELAALDCNADGVLNALDETYAQLALWQDRNANGITDQGELQDLVNSNVFELYVALCRFEWNLTSAHMTRNAQVNG